MRTEICIFEGKSVSFETDREHNLMINATEMAKIFGADVNEFTRNTGTENFVKALSQTENSRFENEFSPAGVFVKVVVGGRHSGTWMDKRVALKFAAWLNPFFEVWVYSTIEDVLFGRMAKREKSFERTFAIQHEIEDLTDKPDKTGDDFLRYLELQKQLKYEKAYRRSLTVEDSNEMNKLF